MDLPADPAAPVAIRPGTTGLRRRPSGEPPPLPRSLRRSGIGWLAATVVLVAWAVAVFSRGLRGIAVTVTVADDAVVRWFADRHVPGLVGACQALAALSSWAVLSTVPPVLLVVLIVLRRFRHLVVWLLVITVLQIVAGNLLARWVQRPRPFGVEFRAAWRAWAMPSLELTLFTAGLVTLLYCLVPEGRWRNLGKAVAAVVVALVGLSRIALGVDAPSDVLVSAVLGVTAPLLAFRWFTPGEVFPVSYRRGRAAPLDVGGARGEAIRRALPDQPSLTLEEGTPLGLGRPAR